MRFQTFSVVSNRPPVSPCLQEIILLREIDAQHYLLSVTEKYKIPIEETETTRKNLAKYEELLKQYLDERAGDIE